MTLEGQEDYTHVHNNEEIVPIEEGDDTPDDLPLLDSMSEEFSPSDLTDSDSSSLSSESEPHIQYGLITIENLPVNMHMNDLIHAFTQFGTVYDIVHRKVIVPGCYGGAQVLFQQYTDAERAMQYFNGLVVMGHILSVRIEPVFLPSSVQLEDILQSMAANVELN